MCTFEDDYKNINVQDYVMESASGVGVYCGTYRKYNNGSTMGAWIDLEKCSDADEFFAVCRKLHEDESDPEFMFQDFQGFPRELYSESMCSDDVERILEWLELSEDDRDMVEDFVDAYGGGFDDIDFLENIRSRCLGKWDSTKDYTDQEADEMIDAFESRCRYEYDCKGAAGMISKMREFFDYEAYHRTAMLELSQGSIHGYLFRDE